MKKVFILLLPLVLITQTILAQYVVFSGVANNSTDNTAALNAAFQQGSTVFIPAGSNYYKIAGTVNIPDGKTIIFDAGAKFNVTGNLKGSNTTINAGENQIFKNTSVINGTWTTNYIYAAWTGAVGNGSTDDFDALNLFFKLLGITDNTESRLGVNKNYYIKNQILQDVNKEINLDGRGSRIFRKYSDLSSNEYILRLEGVVNVEKTLTANLVKGQLTMKVNNTTGLTTNMGVEILSNDLYGQEYMGGSSWHYHYKGLMSKIKTISGNTITLDDTIPFNINSAEVWAVRFFTVTPVTIRNLKFSAENITGTNHINNFALSQLFDVELDNITCNPLGYLGISTNSIYNGLFKNITCTEPASGGDNYHFGVYGIVPQLNVNCTYENIHVQSVTHGIAFTNEPSYNVLVKNSYFKASWYLSNAVDSHASHKVKFVNDTIYGAQGNWGTFIFEDCELHEIYYGKHDIWNEREGASRGNLEVYFNNCNFYTEDNGSSITSIIYRQPSIGSTTNKYTILNSNFYLENNASYLSNAVSTGPATNFEPFRVEGNSFYGNGTLFLPKEYTTSQTAQGGVFTFKNNYYSLVYWSNPPYDQFQTVDILNNSPVNPSTSDFWVNWDGSMGNINFKNNHFVGTFFWIKDCTGNILFNNNNIYNNQHKSTSSYKNRNYITGNSNLTFTNNNLNTTFWTLTGNKTVSDNVSNGLTQPGEPVGSWATINTPGSAIETGLTMEGVTNYTIISRAKMDNLTSDALQNIVGSSAIKLAFGFNPYGTNPYFKTTIRNVDGTVVKPTLTKFYMDNNWHTYVFIMQNGILKAYMDGIPLLSYDASDIYNKMYPTGTVQIGGSNSSEFWSGPIQTFAIYNRALSLSEANSFAQNPNTNISGQIYKLATNTDAPVGYWKFDETSGNTAYDDSGNNYTGTLINGPVWTNGKIGNALQFNGINQNVDCGTSAGLDMGVQDFTVSAWVKMGTNQTSYPTFVSKGGNSSSTAGYWFYLSGSYLKLAISDGASRIVASSGAVSINDNAWHHVAVSVSRYGNATFYIDGENKGEYDVSQFAGKLVSNSSRSLTIASLGTSSTTYFNGLLDDLKVFKRSLTSMEISTLANLDASNNLLSHWAFDENSGTVAVDSSGNQFNGSLLNGPIWSSGMKGNSLKFDGIDDRVDVGSYAALEMGIGDFSVSTWVKMGSNQLPYPTILAKGGTSNTNAGYWFYISGQKIKFVFGDGNQRISTSSNTVNVMDNTWHHIAVTVDRDGNAVYYVDGVNSGTYDVSSFNGKDISNPSRVLIIGTTGGSTSLMNGYLDDVKMFNKSLSQNEIVDLMQLSSPQNNQGDYISYWALDETSGTTANDTGSNDYDGTLLNGPLWSQGMVNNALQFDGTNDIIDCGNGSGLDMGTDDWSVAAWVKMGTNQNVYPTILAKGASSNSVPGYWMYVYGSRIRFTIGDGTQRITTYSEILNLTDNSWHHIAVTADRDGNATFYFDGNAAGTYDVSSFNGKILANSSRTLTIGGSGGSTSFFNGKIDEVQIYRRVLSSNEIATLANNQQTYTLISHWAFDENSGNIAIDSSEYVANDGTLYGPLRKIGIKGNALEFDGQNDHVECGTDTVMDMGTGDLTISSYIKMGPDQLSYPTIVSKGGTSNANPGFWFYISGQKIKFTFSDGTQRLSTYSNTVNLMDNAWHHVVVVVDRDGDAVFYVDGVNSGTYNVSSFDGKDITNPSRQFTIGSANTSSTTFLNGKIDDVKIFNAALSESEILALMDIPQNFSFLTGLEEQQADSSRIEIFPNPFTDIITLKIAAKANNSGNVFIYDTKGLLVKTFHNISLTSGVNEIFWNGTNDSGSEILPGMYFIKFISGSTVEKVTAVKMN